MFKNLFNKFKKKSFANFNAANFPLHTDMHSHLLPELDDGVKSFDESIEIIKGLAEMGYKKLITTPHIMGDFYRNDRGSITKKLEELKVLIAENNIEIEIEAAAEYFMDEWFDTKLKSKDLLTFGKNYVLVETSFLNKPYNLEDVLFNIQAAGYQPVLAHPERYSFIKHFEELDKLYESGTLFQVNLTSLEGNNSLKAIKTIKYMIEKKLIHFLATDIHHRRHFEVTKSVIQSELFEKAVSLDLINKKCLE